MDTFRKWLNKPKADDKSLLARFYHADRALTAVASELDSFDGRAEPDRCSRLVSRLRQGQDKVLSITNHIMEELLGEDRAQRAFRAKFPEEVLQENLAGQLWFGAECLAAGSSIMNREFESTAMRPLAQAVTKSLENVRNLLRNQCLRNNIPNSPTLKLDINDSATEQLYESLKIFDRLFAEFELRYVSAMVQVKSKHEYEMQELICVLFSETLNRALKIGLLEQDQVDSYDPALMFSIPRLAIITGLIVYPRGPLNMDMPAENLSEMFRPFRTILIKIRDLLRTLNKNELNQLEKLLCTNEEIHLKSLNAKDPPKQQQQPQSIPTNKSIIDSNKTITNICDDTNIKSYTSQNDNITSSKSNINRSGEGNLEGATSTSSSSISKRKIKKLRRKHSTKSVSNDDDDDNDVIVGSPITRGSLGSSSSSSSATTKDISSDWSSDDDEHDPDKDNENLVVAECASGYLIPNTNFGNLLQSTEDPLTDNFVASEDELIIAAKTVLRNSDESVSTDILENNINNNNLEEQLDITSINISNNETNITPSCSTIRMETSIDSSEENNDSSKIRIDSETSKINSRRNSMETSSNICDKNATPTSSLSSSRHSHSKKLEREPRIESSTKSSNSSTYHRSHHSHRHHHHHHHNNNNISTSSSNKQSSVSHRHLHSKRRLSKSHTTVVETSSSGDTSSSLSDGDQHETKVAIKSASAGRMKFKSTENLLHRLFVCIAGVADQLQTNFASDLRHILRSVFLINTSPIETEMPKIQQKPKDPEQQDLFEFRPSANDVIQPNQNEQENNGSGGSNQSIYSTAEEVNPEYDNVFTSETSLGRNSLDLVCATPPRHSMGRSRSLGEEQNEIENNRGQPQQQLLQERRRLSSQGSSSCQSDSSSNSSPINSSRRGEYFQQQQQQNEMNTANIHSSHQTSVNATRQVSTTRRTLSSSSKPSPPAWIPDEDAPRCMSCTTQFTAFRRRHHCRNCGGVFCGQCSNVQAPLPKYGLTKAVRVCRDCYIREISVNGGNSSTSVSTAITAAT